MQSAEQSKQDTLKVQIEQLFKEVVSVWKDTDIKKNEAVKRLAARMEEFYLSVGMPISSISRDISRRMEEVGIKTANHVHDYLEEKYKRDYTPPNYNLSNAIQGDILPKNRIEESLKGDFQTMPKDELQEVIEYGKRIEVAFTAAKQAADIRKIAYNSDQDHIPSKEYEKVTTDMPEPEKKLAYNAWNTFVMPQVRTLFHTAEGILSALEKLPPEDDQDQELAKAFELYGNMLKSLNDFMAPFKDLKYATTIKRWWRSVIRFYDHGKHAAAVMDAISSHKHLEERELSVNAVNCPEKPCANSYFATLPDDINLMEKLARPQLELLIAHINDYHYCGLKRKQNEGRPDTLEPETLDETLTKLMPKLTITRQTITVQVPKERDTTREQVGDRIKYLVELAINFVPNIKALEVLCNWREKTGDPRVAARRIDANPKLSDLA